MAVDVVTIPNIELVRAGVHEISTGTWTVTAADLADAVAAYRAGIVRDPVIKLGHEGPLAGGAPALGRVRNLRTTRGGTTLVGDFVDVPRAIAAFLGRAWPSRSVEGFTDYEAADGRTYGFVLAAVALLGEVMPGIHDLADIPDVAALYGVAAQSGRHVVIAAAGSDTTAADHRARAVVIARARRTRSAQSISAERIPS